MATAAKAGVTFKTRNYASCVPIARLIIRSPEEMSYYKLSHSLTNKFTGFSWLK